MLLCVCRPIVEIAYEWLYLFRALFNIFTWQDPILSFWISIFGPVVVVVLHLFPWRIALGIVGIVLFGPHNWAIRVVRERKGTTPPDMDKIVKKKIRRAGGDDIEQEPLFCNDAYGNDPLDYSSLDTSNMKHIAVPYSQLSYNPRFYDWPPEPEYARVLKGDSLSKAIVLTSLVDSDSFRTQNTESSSSTKRKKPWQTVRGAIKLSALRSKKKGA
jgi:hypothetical protein